MSSPPTIAGIEPDEVRGDIERLLPPLERALRASADCLRAGITLRDNVRVYLREITLTVPDDWVRLTAVNGFADIGPPNYGSLAVRKEESGVVRLRERVNRPAGAPALNTVIINLPEGYGPAAGILRDTVGTGGVYDVQPAGLTGGVVRYIAGDPTASFSFGACTWTARDMRPAPWPEPVVLELEVPWRPAYVQVLTARYARERLRRATGAGPVLWSDVQARAGVRRLEISRILGLAPGQEYTLLLGVFPE